MAKEVLKSEIELFVISKAKALREQANLSQSELAFRLDVSNGFIGQVESPNSPSKYNLDHIDKLAVIFNCSPKDFLPETNINK
ncbi:helix-turn-helix domain-containing protein [Pedobacter sp. GSP4]|uniref:helix-turn-helix domain-containing protein n=1 Tax=Pedobacter sp. GSP4 TaxID=3453716 RepID=UPI003EEB16D1